MRNRRSVIVEARKNQPLGAHYATQQTELGDALRCAALAGLDIVFLPTYITGEDLRDGALVPLLTGVPRHSTGLYAAYPVSWYLSRKVQAMIDWVLDEFSPEPDWDRNLPLSFE